MNKIKSILAFVALMLCGGAWAANTMACWNSDFVNGENRNGFITTLQPSDSSIVAFQDNGTVKLTSTSSVSSRGMEILASKNGIGSYQASILVKYSGYSNPGAWHSLFGAVWNGNMITVYRKGTGQIGVAYNGTQNGDSAVAYDVPASGIMLVEISGSNAPKGVRVSFAAKNGDSYDDFAMVGSGAFGVFYSSQPIMRFMIGGTTQGTGSYYRPAMTIEGVAILADHITLQEAKSFDWRSTKEASPTQ